MIRVDFYVVSDTGDEVRARAVCRLAEKAWTSGHRVLVLTESAGSTARLDEMLWTFRQDSFVPHASLEQTGSGVGDIPVLVGAASPSGLPEGLPPGFPDVLINFTDDVPLAYSQFGRVAEIVDGSERSRAKGRERFRAYRSDGCEVHSHDI